MGEGTGRISRRLPAARAGAPPLGEALALGLVGVFFSFGGFWEASRIAGDVREPERTLPRALALGVVLSTLVYVVTTCAFIYLVPVGEARAHRRSRAAPARRCSAPRARRARGDRRALGGRQHAGAADDGAAALCRHER